MNRYGPIQLDVEPETRRVNVSHLTPREHQIVALICEGLSNKEIARRLSIAVDTVKSHVHNALIKLGVSTRLEVAAMVHAGERSLRLAEVTQTEVAQMA